MSVNIVAEVLSETTCENLHHQLCAVSALWRDVSRLHVMLLLNITVLAGLFGVGREFAGLKLSSFISFCSLYLNMRKFRLLKILLITSERKK